MWVWVKNQASRPTDRQTDRQTDVPLKPLGSTMKNDCLGAKKGSASRISGDPKPFKQNHAYMHAYMHAYIHTNIHAYKFQYRLTYTS